MTKSCMVTLPKQNSNLSCRLLKRLKTFFVTLFIHEKCIFSSAFSRNWRIHCGSSFTVCVVRQRALYKNTPDPRNWVYGAGLLGRVIGEERDGKVGLGGAREEDQGKVNVNVNVNVDLYNASS